MPNNLIEVRNLTKIYTSGDLETPALRGVSFNIQKGEFTAVMGPSGSGKSTLLHILGFLDRHTSGEYRFEGKTIDDYSETELARIRNKKMGFIFQAFNLLARTNVLNNIMLPLMYSDLPEKEWNRRAKEAADSVGLTHRLNHSPSQLSGGEKQRVAIARALVTKPSVIFADEPTGNLDSKSGQVVMNILQKLNKQDGHTIILITHEAHIAKYTNRILRIFDGRIESDTLLS